MKAFSYVRVSSKGQSDGDGFPRQRAKIAAWAKSAGAVIVREFAEDGVSGTSEVKDRPALTDLLATIMANGVRVVVVEKADRLARDLIVSELILAEFAKLGVTVYEAEGGTDLTGAPDNPTGRLIRQILAAVAEFDKTSIVLRTRAARERIRRSGKRCEGRKPFGQTEAERAAIDRMRQLRRKPVKGARLSLADVAAALDAEGHQSRTGKPWTAEAVRKILSRKESK